MTQEVIVRTARGLFSQFNKINAIPEGGLLEAENVTIDREGVLSKVRGQNRYGTVAAAQIDQILEYRNRVIRHFGTTLQFDSDGAGTFTAYTGSFTAPDANSRIRGLETKRDLFFTESTGIQKTDALTTSPKRAGMSQGLNINLSFTGIGGSWFTPPSQVGYRILFGRIDANMQEIKGTPSFREFATNSLSGTLNYTFAAGVVTVTHNAHGFTTGDIILIVSPSDPLAEAGPHTITTAGVNAYTYTVVGAPANGTLKDGKAFDVNVNFTLPFDVVAGDFYEIYRTALAASDTLDPGDQHFKLIRNTLTAADIVAGQITYTDTFDPAFFGEELYTNATKETISQTNDRPPWCKDLALFKGHNFYSNTMLEQFKVIQLLTITGITDDVDTITITNGTLTRTYTFSTAVNYAANKFQRKTTKPTLAQNVQDTAKSLVDVINRDTGNTAWYAYYFSQVGDSPGIVLIKNRVPNQAAFSFTANSSGTGGKFSPTLPTAGATIISDNDRRRNRLFRSKFEKPEAVPVLNFDDVGSESYEILRVLALRESLIILKEEGIWRLSGETDGASGAAFVISSLDPSISVVCPEAAVVLNNSVYCMATQGVIQINEAGTTLISRPVEDELKLIFGFTNFMTLTHAVAYESDRKYQVFVQETSSDTVAQISFVYDYLTDTWTRRRRTVSAARVLFLDDKLYMAHGADFFILKERKSFLTNLTDYRDEDIAVTVTATGTIVNSLGVTVSTVTVTYAYATKPLIAGWLFRQDSATAEALIDVVTSLGGTSYRLQLDTLITNFSNGAATVSIAIPSRIRWAPQVAENVGEMKQFSFVQIYMEENLALKSRVGFFSDVDASETFVNDITVTPGYGWGEDPWGDAGWGDEIIGPGTPLRVPVPTPFSRCRALTVVYEHKRAKENFRIAQLSYSFHKYGDKTTRGPK